MEAFSTELTAEEKIPPDPPLQKGGINVLSFNQLQRLRIA